MSPNSKIIWVQGYLLWDYRDDSLSADTKVHHGNINDSASET